MTQEEIREQHVARMKRVREARDLLDAELIEVRVLQLRCKHPARKGWVCPDCGHDNE